MDWRRTDWAMADREGRMEFGLRGNNEIRRCLYHTSLLCLICQKTECERWRPIEREGGLCLASVGLFHDLCEMMQGMTTEPIDKLSEMAERSFVRSLPLGPAFSGICNRRRSSPK